MDNKHLHVVAFDVPYPPNYGGVIDVYYKIKALADLGVKIHLHCFEYGRPLRKELSEICYTVKSYPRQLGVVHFFNSLPYIVNTRRNNDLLNNLSKDNFPVLFEGLHDCYYLENFRLINRKRIVRMHNIESDYYYSLASVETNWFKKLYFLIEAKKIEKYQHTLKSASALLAISEKDSNFLKKINPATHVIPAFHQNKDVKTIPESSNYALYHGNLSVGENNDAALFLVNQVFNNLPYKLIIAGNNPSKKLIKAVKQFKNIELLTNTDYQTINQLIALAKINVLPTFQATGIKLKLLNSLYIGKHCLVNQSMVSGTGLEELCTIANTAEEWKDKIQMLFNTSFNMVDETEKRKNILNLIYNNEKNAQKLIEIIWKE